MSEDTKGYTDKPIKPFWDGEEERKCRSICRHIKMANGKVILDKVITVIGNDYRDWSSQKQMNLRLWSYLKLARHIRRDPWLQRFLYPS